jgi:hypothetical protein
MSAPSALSKMNVFGAPKPAAPTFSFQASPDATPKMRQLHEEYLKQQECLAKMTPAERTEYYAFQKSIAVMG